MLKQLGKLTQVRRAAGLSSCFDYSRESLEAKLPLLHSGLTCSFTTAVYMYL